MRLRLIFSFIAIALVSILSLVLLVRQTTATEVRAFMFRGGISGDEGLVEALEEYYEEHGSWAGVENILRPGQHGRGAGGGPMAGGAQGMGNFRLADATGRLVYSSPGNSSAGSEDSGSGMMLPAGELEQAISLEVEHRIVGYLLVGESLRFSQAEEMLLLTRLNRSALSAALIAVGLSLVLALLLAYRLLRPVRELTRATQELAAGNLSKRVEVKGGDELATLGVTFNHMADSLQKGEASRRAMTSDIAHELRTPLAVQRAHLEALQDGIFPLNGENLTPILEQNQMLTRLVEDLHMLALADAGQIELVCTLTDIAALTRRNASRFAAQAEAHQVVIEVSVAENCPPVWADAGRVEQILSNLISNALRYSPPGESITLSLRGKPSGEAVELEVRDRGPGIPAEALPRVFERFYRADKSRSRTEGGSGLGLAIARKLALAHGGSLSAANHPQGGAIFTLTLLVEASKRKNAHDTQ